MLKNPPLIEYMRFILHLQALFHLTVELMVSEKLTRSHRVDYIPLYGKKPGLLFPYDPTADTHE
jgi:hypothetical protein